MRPTPKTTEYLNHGPRSRAFQLALISPGETAHLFGDQRHAPVLRKPREKERRIVGRLLPAHQVHFLARGPGGLVANAVWKMKPLQSVTS